MEDLCAGCRAFGDSGGGETGRLRVGGGGRALRRVRIEASIRVLLVLLLLSFIRVGKSPPCLRGTENRCPFLKKSHLLSDGSLSGWCLLRGRNRGMELSHAGLRCFH